MNRNQQAAPFEREADAASRWSGTGCSSQAQGLTFELEQLFRVHLTANLFYSAQQLALERRKLIHLRC
jgi:hypothetical protein